MSNVAGKRERVDCPVTGCKMSQIEGGIDVRGLKAHLMSRHGYDKLQASQGWEQATHRKSRGRSPKPRAIEYVDTSSIGQSSPLPIDERLRLWREGYLEGFRDGRNSRD
jgi:hypothetical protein